MRASSGLLCMPPLDAAPLPVSACHTECATPPCVGETCLAIEQEAGCPAGNKNADAKGGASGAGRGDGHEVAF